jgi:hypothetical protein
MEILQKELKIFRFKNQHPSKEENQKYDYQLFQNMRVVNNILSDNEFSIGKITAIPGSLKMDLINHTANISMREMEETDMFLIPITIVN